MASQTQTLVKCPRCGEQLMQSKSKYVCINCGYSAELNQYRMAAPQPAPAKAPAKAPAPKAAAKPIPAPQPAPQPAPAPAPVMTTPPPAPAWIEPQRDEAIIAKRKLEAVIGEKQINKVEQSVGAATDFSKGFYQTYLGELKELVKGDTGKAIKVVGVILGGILLLVLLFTVHPVPGL